MTMIQWVRPSQIAGLAFMAVAGFGCAQEASETPNTEIQEFSERSDNLFMQSNTKWSGGHVRVCYDTDGNNPALLEETKRQLNASWSRAGSIVFIDWGACNLSRRASGFYSTVALHFCYAGGASTNCDANFYAGAEYRGKADGAGMRPPTNHGDGTYTPGVTHVSIIGDDPDPFKTRFRYEVLHEFGHALGYRHEQDSNLNTDGSGGRLCDNTVDTTAGGVSQTSFYDGDSLMNYCGRDPLTGSDFMTMLSNGDVLGVRTAYGRNPSSHGFMIKSDTNGGLAVNAWNGASEGATLKLHSQCKPDNPDCTWTYQRGMLVSDRDPSLAINAWGGAGEGVTLKLTRLCTANNLDCTWTYKNGMFWSDRNPSLAINAWGGAVHGAELKTTALCTAANSDCTWTLPDVMLSSNRDPSLAVNAQGGAVNQAALVLHNGCSPSNQDCLFTFTKGMLLSSRNNTLAVNAWMGATNGATIRLNNGCSVSNKDCTWTWSRGQIVSDNTSSGTLPINAVGGGVHQAPLKLSSACAANNPDCVFSGLFAMP